MYLRVQFWDLFGLLICHSQILLEIYENGIKDKAKTFKKAFVSIPSIL